MIPIVLWANWELLAPYVAKDLPNPFTPIIFISHRVPDSPPDDPRYQKGYFDLLFVAYWIIFWSWFRQVLTMDICWPIARRFRIKKEAKLARFGEQGHAMVYFAIMGTWGWVSADIEYARSSHIDGRKAYYGTIADLVVSHRTFLDR